jgi:hypothetical protein
MSPMLMALRPSGMSTVNNLLEIITANVSVLESKYLTCDKPKHLQDWIIKNEMVHSYLGSAWEIFPGFILMY